MLDFALAELYGVETKAFNQAVRRNINRFPEDFTFQLTEAESKSLRSQIVTSKPGRGGRQFEEAALAGHWEFSSLGHVRRSEQGRIK